MTSPEAMRAIRCVGSAKSSGGSTSHQKGQLMQALTRRDDTAIGNRPMRACLPASLLSLIDAGMRYDRDFELAGIDARWKPPAIRAETLAAIVSDYIPALRAHLAPATHRQI